jgi:hypothetical protein
LRIDGRRDVVLVFCFAENLALASSFRAIFRRDAELANGVERSIGLRGVAPDEAGAFRFLILHRGARNRVVRGYNEKAQR